MTDSPPQTPDPAFDVHPPLDEHGLRTDGPTLEEYVDAGYSADTYPPSGYAVRPSAPPEASVIGQLVEAHLAKSATPPKPRFLDMGKGYLGPTAINGT